VATKAKQQNYLIAKSFDEINERIQRPPTTIEELTETRKQINEIGITIEKHRKEIASCMRTYDICGEFNHEFTNVENDEKWKLFGAPQRVMQVIEQQTAVLEKQKDAFVKEME
jgi:chromosome segregation ATPase